MNDVLFRMADVFNSQEMKDHWLKYNQTVFVDADFKLKE